MNGNKHSDNGRPRGVELRSEGMVSMAGGVPRRLLWLSAAVMAVAAAVVGVVATALTWL